MSCNIPFVFLRLNAPRSISVCMLLLFECGIVFTLSFILGIEVFLALLVMLKFVFPLSNVDEYDPVGEVLIMGMRCPTR